MDSNQTPENENQVTEGVNAAADNTAAVENEVKSAAETVKEAVENGKPESSETVSGKAEDKEFSAAGGTTDILTADKAGAGYTEPYTAAPVEEEKKNATGLIALILGIVSVLLCGLGLIPGVIALILGIKSKDEDNKGKIGMILGIVGLVLSVIGMIVGLGFGIATATGIAGMAGKGTTTTELLYATTEDSAYNYFFGSEDTTTEDDWYSTTTEDYSTTSTYETERKGNSTLGYIDVPTTYYSFQEAGGLGENLDAQQYSYGMYDIITHITYGNTMTTPEFFANNLEDYANSQEGQDAGITWHTCTKTNFAGYDGYFLTHVYGNDNINHYIFIFEDENQNVQYLSVEGIADDEYADLYLRVFENYNLNY